jgi:hypothetical protein
VWAAVVCGLWQHAADGLSCTVHNVCGPSLFWGGRQCTPGPDLPQGYRSCSSVAAELMRTQPGCLHIASLVLQGRQA